VKINSIKTLRGANYWSQVHPLLLQVNITFSAPLNSDLIYNELRSSFSDIKIDQSKEIATALPNILAQLAITLQQKAEIEVSFWHTQPTLVAQTHTIVFEYKSADSGELAIEYAIEILQAFSNQKEAEIKSKIDKIATNYQASLPSLPIQTILKKATSQHIPIIPANGNKNWQLGYGKNGIDIKENNIAVLDKLLADQRNWRVPIIAVTGSNGKTTTTRLIAHVIAKANYTVGFTTSDGIYVNDDMIDHGDTTGPASAEMVLRHDEVEVAVLETARGGMVRAGIGFDNCDIAVITNVQEDHLGISDIETMDDLARVKSIIVGALAANGTAVLNANNDYTIKIGKATKSNTAWFSINKENPFFCELLKDKSNTLAYVENGSVMIQNKGISTAVSPLINIPITFNGTASFMVENVLAAVLALTVFGIETQHIANGLRTFLPSVEQTPGRMNLFEINDKKLLVDFAHNPDGFAGIRDFLQTIKSPQKIGLIVGTGDRKDSDTIELGQIAAQMFDVVLIHQVKFLRGQAADRIVDLLVQGITTENPNAQWQRIPDEAEPLQFALSIAEPKAFITSLSDVIDHPANLVAQYTQTAN
jgi:UDP-N-acetylmuramyl tripeptide synthase